MTWKDIWEKREDKDAYHYHIAQRAPYLFYSNLAYRRSRALDAILGMVRIIYRAIYC